jgi:hypothetical protein
MIVYCGSGLCFGAAGCGNGRFSWFFSVAWAAAGVFSTFFEPLSGTFTYSSMPAQVLCWFSGQ